MRRNSCCALGITRRRLLSSSQLPPSLSSPTTCFSSFALFSESRKHSIKQCSQPRYFSSSPATKARSLGDESPSVPLQRANEDMIESIKQKQKQGTGVEGAPAKEIETTIPANLVPPGKVQEVHELICGANLALLEQRFQEAIQITEQALKIAPKLGTLYHTRATIHQAAENLEEAIKDFSRAAQMEPTRSMASVFLSRGKCYLLLPKQDIAAALADFDKSITLDPTIPAAFYNRGLVHENMGRHARAADDYTRCVELAEQLGGFDWHGHHALSNLYMAQGNFKKALKHIQVCAIAYPDESRFQSRTAWCLWQIEKMNPLKDNSKEIIACFTKAIDLDKQANKQNYLDLLRRGSYLCEKGKLQEGLKDYEAALLVDPNNIGIITQMGGVYIPLQNFEKTLELLLPLIQANTTQEFTFVYVIQAYAALENEEKVKELSEKFLKLYPQSKIAKHFQMEASQPQPKNA